MRWIYVSGPLTQGDPWANAHLAIAAGERLRRAGFLPIVPHMSVLWAMVCPGASYEDWMQFDLELLSRCDGLLRLSGPSSGADREVARALELRLPVYYSEVELCRSSALSGPPPNVS